MIRTPTTLAALKVSIRLERLISERLAGDPLGHQLFEAYASLLDSLLGGSEGGVLACSYDELVAADLRDAQAVLDELQRRGEVDLLSLPSDTGQPLPRLN